MDWRTLADPGSLTRRVALGFVAAFSVLALSYAVLTSWMVRHFSQELVYISLRGQAEGIAGSIRLGPDGQLAGVQLDAGEQFGFDAYFANLQYRILDADGQVVASSDGSRDSLLPDVPLAAQRERHERRLVGGTPFYLGAWAHTVAGRRFIVQVGRSDGFAALARDAVTPALWQVVVLLAAASAAVFVVVWLLAMRTIVRPIADLSRRAAALDARQLALRLPERDVPLEIRPLVVAFNGALERLEAAFARQKSFVANAAHELKTPLALIRSELEAPVSESRRLRLQADIERLARILGQLLQLAEVDDPQTFSLVELDVQAALAEAVDQLAWAAARKDVAVVLVAPDAPVRVPADAGALFVLARNLVENAIGYSPEGAVVRVVLRSDGFEVHDEGPGVAAEERERIFERFWRAPGQRRAGAGLGLTICSEICAAHGWSIRCIASWHGGACLQVRFSPEAGTQAARGVQSSPGARQPSRPASADPPPLPPSA